MNCSGAQVDTAQISLPVRLGGLGVHLMSDCDGAACGTAFLAAAALTHRAVSGGSEHFDPFKGASGNQLAAMWSGLYDTVEPLESGGVRRLWVDRMLRCLTLLWGMGYLGLRIRCLHTWQCADSSC